MRLVVVVAENAEQMPGVGPQTAGGALGLAPSLRQRARILSALLLSRIGDDGDGPRQADGLL